MFADGENDEALARLSLAVLLTLRGTPFLYNGEEIGMTDLMLTDISQFWDTPAVWMYNTALEEKGTAPEDLLPLVAKASRDRCRTPLQWANAPNGGFSPSEVSPWLPVNPNYAAGVNVSDQLKDPDSLLSFYRRMIHLRKENPALMAGDYRPLSGESEPYLAFTRTSAEQKCLVVLNFSGEPQDVATELEASVGRVIFSNKSQRKEVALKHFSVQPFEIVIAEVV